MTTKNSTGLRALSREHSDGPAVPTREEVAARAYALFLEHGAEDGRDVEDWLQAERELTEHAASKDD